MNTEDRFLHWKSIPISVRETATPPEMSHDPVTTRKFFLEKMNFFSIGYCETEKDDYNIC